MEALLHQVGPDENYMPPNQSKSLGNDDQAFWALTVMGAAERKFPNPPPDQPQWLSLAQAVFNTQAARWDEEHCGGGLRWQIYSFNRGYHYKNTVSNGAFFLLASRLARYTGNTTYMDWAVKTWDWTRQVGLMTEEYKFYDGYDVTDDCSKVDPIQWTYNAGLYLAGAAFLYDFVCTPPDLVMDMSRAHFAPDFPLVLAMSNQRQFTQTSGDNVWRERVNGIMQMTRVFFKNDIMVEVACEPYGTCNVDQRSFKALRSPPRLVPCPSINLRVQNRPSSPAAWP
jgi:mannan endo-1,6-alpha-mannosidase